MRRDYARVHRGAFGAMQVERRQKLVSDRLPPVRIEPQQMAVAGNTVEQLKARAAAGCGECLIVSADHGSS